MSRKLRSLFADLAAGLGMVSLTAGAWLIARPAGLIVAGLLLLWQGAALEHN
jgi:hypothetical protein